MLKSSLVISSILIILIAFSYNNNQNVNAESTYTGAVVEYSPIPFTFPYNVSKDLAQQYMLMNIQQYFYFIEQAISEKAQIIVFPEYGITGNYLMNRDRALSFLEEIPSPKSSDSPIIPCDNDEFSDRPILQSLSCGAIKYDIVIVVNMGDVQQCNQSSDPNCPEDDRYQFNTQVAFGNNGAIIGRYHKSHLYGEQPVFDQPSTPDIEYFKTDFGVTFGMMICFDILFEQPQLALMELGIHNFVYSTEWVNANYAYARQIQQALSYRARANVLAANIGTMSVLSGSGIYSNGQPLVSYFNPTYISKSQLSIAELPIDPTIKQSDKLRQSPVYSKPLESPKAAPSTPTKLLWDLSGVPPNSFNASFTIFKPTSNQNKVTLQSEHNGFICTLTYSTSKIPGDEYFSVISFSGYFNGFFNAQICMVANCLDNSEDGCSAIIFESDTSFSYFQLSAPFSSGYNVNPMVYSVNDLSDFYEGYILSNNTLTMQGSTDPIISVSFFAQQWVNATTNENTMKSFLVS